MKTSRKNRVGMVFQDCGGAGKTDLAKNIGAWYAQRNHPIHIIDAEMAVKGSGQICAYYPQATFLNINTVKQFDDVLLAASKNGTALVDVGANAGKILQDWFVQGGTDQLDDMETDVTLFVPITAPESTSISFIDWVAKIPKELFDVVIAKNEKDGTDFQMYDGTVAGRAFQADYKPNHIRIPKREATFEAHLVARRLTMLQAIALFQLGELELLGPTLSDPLTMGRIQRHHKFIMKELDSVAHLLCPPKL